MPAPIIETPRLILRGWTDADLEPWFQMNADPRVMEFFPSTYTRERSDEVAAFVREQLERDGYGTWVVEIKGRPLFAGVVTLQAVPFKASFTPAKEIGWRFVAEVWGHGYATEAANALLEFAFETLAWDEVIAMTAKPNVRSQRVMQRLGMRYDPDGDFDHPRIAQGHPLRRHVIYRIRRP